jgi:cyanophycinase
VIKNRADAEDAKVGETVRNAEVIFFAGGDQCNYVSYFKGTEVEKGVEYVYKKGGGIGGTSAGLAILGEFVYDSCTGNLSVRSNEALMNPYNGSMSITDDLFKFAHLHDTITDTHFVARDRMGRSLAFIARQLKDHHLKKVYGIAVDEKTSVVVDKKGMARVMGKGPAYFILGDHQPEMCRPGVPLTYSNYKIWKVAEGGTFDLEHKPAQGYNLVSVVDGKITSNPY